MTRREWKENIKKVPEIEQGIGENSLKWVHDQEIWKAHSTLNETAFHMSHMYLFLWCKNLLRASQSTVILCPCNRKTKDKLSCSRCSGGVLTLLTGITTTNVLLHKIPHDGDLTPIPFSGLKLLTSRGLN